MGGNVLGRLFGDIAQKVVPDAAGEFAEALPTKASDIWTSSMPSARQAERFGGALPWKVEGFQAPAQTTATLTPNPAREVLNTAIQEGPIAGYKSRGTQLYPVKKKTIGGERAEALFRETFTNPELANVPLGRNLLAPARAALDYRVFDVDFGKPAPNFDEVRQGDVVRFKGGPMGNRNAKAQRVSEYIVKPRGDLELISGKTPGNYADVSRSGGKYYKNNPITGNRERISPSEFLETVDKSDVDRASVKIWRDRTGVRHEVRTEDPTGIFPAYQESVRHPVDYTEAPRGADAIKERMNLEMALREWPGLADPIERLEDMPARHRAAIMRINSNPAGMIDTQLRMAWEFIDNLPETLSEGLSMRTSSKISGTVYPGRAAGMYNPITSVMTIDMNQANVRTLIHEFFHHIAQFIPVRELDGLRRQYVMELLGGTAQARLRDFYDGMLGRSRGIAAVREALKSDHILYRRFKEVWEGDIAAVPDEQLDEWIKKLEENGYFNETNPAPVIGIVGGEGVTLPSLEDLNRLRNMSYRYKNFNEWLAEVFTDRALIETLSRVVPGYLGTIERIMMMLRDWMVTGYNYATFRGYKNSSRSIYNNLMKGTWEPPNRWGTLSADAKKRTPTTPAGRWGTLGVGEPLGARQDIALGKGGERFTDRGARELEERYARGERVLPFSLPGLEGYASDEVSSLAYLGDIAGGNPEKLLRRLREEGEDLPAIFMATGEGMYDMPTNIQTSLKIAPEMKLGHHQGAAANADSAANKIILSHADETLARALQSKSPEYLRNAVATRMAVSGYVGLSENSTDFMIPSWVPGSGYGYQLLEEAFSTSPRPIAQWARAGMEQLFTPTRTLLREKFGDYIHLYRSQTPETRYGAEDVSAGRNALSYFPTAVHADDWNNGWNVQLSRDVAVDDILWAVYRSSNEPEFIVRSGEQFAVSPDQWVGRSLVGETAYDPNLPDPLEWMLNDKAATMDIQGSFGPDDFEEFIEAVLFKQREVSGQASRYRNYQPLTKQGLEDKIAQSMKAKQANASNPPRYLPSPQPSQNPPPPMSGVKTENLAIFDTWKGHVTAKLIKVHDIPFLSRGHALVHEDSLPVLKTSTDLGMEGFDLGELPIPKLIYPGNIPGLASVPAHKWAGELKAVQAKDALTDAPLGFTQDVPPTNGHTVHGKPLDAQYTKNLSMIWTTENGAVYEKSMGFGKGTTIEESWFHMPLSAQVHDAVWDGSMFQLAEHEWVRHMQSVPWLMETVGAQLGKRPSGMHSHDPNLADVYTAIEEYLQVMQAYSYYTPMSAKHTAEWGFDQSANMDYWVKLLNVAVEDKWPDPSSAKGKLLAALQPITPEEIIEAKVKAKMASTYDQTEFTWVSGQKGSMPGGLYKHNASGIHYYIKEALPGVHGVHKGVEHIKEEALAGALYKLAGVPVADTSSITFSGNKALMSRWIPDTTKMSFTDMSRNADVRSNFVVDAWLANWDVVGLNADNIVLGADDVAYRIDHGGALEFRAQGGSKEFSAPDPGGEVKELTSMLNLATAPEGSRVFKSLTLAELEEGARAVGSVTDEMIEAAVRKEDFLPHVEKRLIESLTGRRDSIVKTFLGEGYVPPPQPNLTQMSAGEMKGMAGFVNTLFAPPASFAGQPPTPPQWYGINIGDSGPLAPNERTDEFIEFVLAANGQKQATTLQYEGGKSIIFGGTGDFKQLPMEGVNYEASNIFHPETLEPIRVPIAISESEWIHLLQGEFQSVFDKQVKELVNEVPGGFGYTSQTAVDDLMSAHEVLESVTNAQMESFLDRMLDDGILVPGWGTADKQGWTFAEMVHYYKSLAQLGVAYSHQGVK